MRTGGLFHGPCRWTLQILCFLSLVNGQCTKFKFPAIDGIFKATKNTTVTLPFLLSTERCNKDDLEFSISVAKKANGIFIDFCKLFLYSNGSCMSFREETCKCEEEKGHYSFTKTFDKSDETVWRWRTSNESIASDKTIEFIVDYPPRITRLSLQSAADHAPLTRAVKPGTSVEILCTFEEGKPASPPFLQNSQGELLDVEHGERQGEIKHVLPDVTCDDVGTISCEAPGALENKTAVLLVECPPKFTEKTFNGHVVSAGQPEELMFQLQSHSREIASCHVTRYPGSKPDVEGKLPVDDHSLNKECLSDVTLFGSPPDLTLNLTLRELTSQDEGEWHLTIANDFGSDNISFSLEIDGLPDQRFSTVLPGPSSTAPSSHIPPSTASTVPTTTRLTIGQSPDSASGQGLVPKMPLGVLITLAVLVVIVIIVIVVIVVKCRRRLSRLRRPPGRQLPILTPDSRPALTSAHIYDDPARARQLNAPATDENASGYMQPTTSTPNPYSALGEHSQPTRPPRLIVGESELQPASNSEHYVHMWD